MRSYEKGFPCRALRDILKLNIFLHSMNIPVEISNFEYQLIQYDFSAPLLSLQLLIIGFFVQKFQ